MLLGGCVFLVYGTTLQCRRDGGFGRYLTVRAVRKAGTEVNEAMTALSAGTRVAATGDGVIRP